MIRIIVAYLATLVAFCAGDFVWLGTVATGFYQSQVGSLMLATPARKTAENGSMDSSSSSAGDTVLIGAPAAPAVIAVRK